MTVRADAGTTSEHWLSYGEAIFQAGMAVEEHLTHRPDDRRRDRARHAGAGGLFEAVIGSHPDLAELHLSVVMWDRALAMALTQLDLTEHAVDGSATIDVEMDADSFSRR